jgi:hypothetical protein
MILAIELERTWSEARLTVCRSNHILVEFQSKGKVYAAPFTHRLKAEHTSCVRDQYGGSQL